MSDTRVAPSVFVGSLSMSCEFLDEFNTPDASNLGFSASLTTIAPPQPGDGIYLHATFNNTCHSQEDMAKSNSVLNITSTAVDMLALTRQGDLEPLATRGPPRAEMCIFESRTLPFELFARAKAVKPFADMDVPRRTVGIRVPLFYGNPLPTFGVPVATAEIWCTQAESSLRMRSVVIHVPDDTVGEMADLRSTMRHMETHGLLGIRDVVSPIQSQKRRRVRYQAVVQQHTTEMAQ